MKYPFKVYQTKVDDHVFWIAESPCLKGCVGQGDSMEAAMNELEENEAIWLETAQEYGIEIPAIPIETVSEYSGKFTVRLAPSVHRVAVELAKKENVSLNQYVNDAIVAQNTRLETMAYVVPQVKEAVSTLKTFIFDSQKTYSNGASLLPALFTRPKAFTSVGLTLSENEPYMIPAGSYA